MEHESEEKNKALQIVQDSPHAFKEDRFGRAKAVGGAAGKVRCLVSAEWHAMLNGSSRLCCVQEFPCLYDMMTLTSAF